MSPRHTEQMPHVGAGRAEKYKTERFFRDIKFLNLHIEQHKWELIKLLDIIDAHRFEEDFCGYDADIWTVTEDASGVFTINCMDKVNGVLQVVSPAQDNDRIEVVQECECWKLVDCYPLYAEIRLQVSNAAADFNNDWWFGLIAGTHLLSGAMNDGVYFKKDDGDFNIDFVTELNGNTTESSAVYIYSDSLWIRLGFYFNGDPSTPRVYYFVIKDEDQPQEILATGSHTTNIVQDEELALGFGLMNGAAASNTLLVDYVKCVQKRVIE